MDIASLTRRDLPFKPPPKGLKAAFDSPMGKVNRQEPVLQKHFKFDLEKIFTEENDIDNGDCYKLFSKCDMLYDREDMIENWK